MQFASEASNDKRRRITRACDTCRRRRVRCDGTNEGTGKCTSCSSLAIECTWDDEVKKRGRRKKNIKSLEERIKILEQAAADRLNDTQDLQNSAASNSQNGLPSYGSQHPIAQQDSCLASSSEDEDLEMLNSRTWRLELDALSHTEGVGISNGRHFEKKVRKLRDDHNPGQPQVDDPSDLEPDFWHSYVQDQLLSWQIDTHFHFPDSDLLPVLIDAYMDNIQYLWPIFHRPSFERMVNSNLHYSDLAFGSVLLLVCAIGARYVDDPRVIPPGGNRRATGWYWFTQVDISRRDLFRPPRLFEVQTYFLAALYSTPIFRNHLAWSIMGIALRMVQQVGAHIKKVYNSIPNATDELWKRSFWALHNLDIYLASAGGKPPSMCDSDFNLGYPIECDDEYWNHNDPNLAFKQPHGTASSISYFVHTCKLRRIQSRVMRSMFSPGIVLKSTEMNDIVMNVNSEINRWHESVPHNLRWESYTSYGPENNVFRNQAAQLKLDHNDLLIVIHRQFINFEQSSPASLAAHAICTTAARSNAKVYDAHPPYQWQLVISSMDTALVLLVGLWGANKLKVRVDAEAVMKDARRCQALLHSFAPMFHTVESMCKTLDGLMGSPDPGTSSSSLIYSRNVKRPIHTRDERIMEPFALQESSHPDAHTNQNFGMPGFDFHIPQEPPDCLGGLDLSSDIPPIDMSSASSIPPSFWDQDILAMFDPATNRYQPLQSSDNPGVFDNNLQM